MSTRIRWGIIGTGRIAGEFAEGLQQIETAEFRSVASRRQKQRMHLRTSLELRMPIRTISN